jgi:hypothetical protein
MEGYGKIYRQIFKSSIAANYEVRHIFMDLCLLCDRHGIIDMTYDAIARETGVPLEKIIVAISDLMREDFESRSRREEGARLVRLDPARPWGWRIVNHAKYRSKEERREYWRAWKAKKRAEQQGKSVDESVDKNQQKSPLASTDVHSRPLASTGVHSRPQTPQQNVHTCPDCPPNQNQNQNHNKESTRAYAQGVDIVEAKAFLSLLSKEAFNRTFDQQHWSTDTEDLVRRAMPLTRADLASLKWLYRLPEDHEIFRVTRRRQSFDALLVNLAGEVQKVRAAKKIAGLPDELDEELEERERRYREEEEAWTLERQQATRELFPEMVAAQGTAAGPPPKFTDLDSDLRARIEARVEENRKKNGSNSSQAAA